MRRLTLVLLGVSACATDPAVRNRGYLLHEMATARQSVEHHEAWMISDRQEASSVEARAGDYAEWCALPGHAACDNALIDEANRLAATLKRRGLREELEHPDGSPSRAPSTR